MPFDHPNYLFIKKFILWNLPENEMLLNEKINDNQKMVINFL